MGEHTLAIRRVRCTIHSAEVGEVKSAEGQLPTDDDQVIDIIPSFDSNMPYEGKTLGVKFRVFKRPEWMSRSQAAEIAEKLKGMDYTQFPIPIPKQGGK